MEVNVAKDLGEWEDRSTPVMTYEVPEVGP